ncbi:MAG: hypothetical protein Q7K39_01070 [Candidatus Magasanikbacteria bacterium]|nr:hypothetical protein [Candidatus Magasanikbacteria bacterium]
MSIKLRLKYQFRSWRAYWSLWRVPRWLGLLPARVAILASVGAMAVLYIVGVSNVSTAGYEVQKLELKIAELNSSNKKIETELAAAESLTAISVRLSAVNMVSAGKVTRLKAAAPSLVAQR